MLLLKNEMNPKRAHSGKSGFHKDYVTYVKSLDYFVLNRKKLQTWFARISVETELELPIIPHFQYALEYFFLKE
jgi:hypothetical protein